MLFSDMQFFLLTSSSTYSPSQSYLSHYLCCKPKSSIKEYSSETFIENTFKRCKNHKPTI